MSRLCAKPICSDLAVRWFDILAVDRRVVERSRATGSAIPLCVTHAERFSVPEGWTIGSDGEAEESRAVPQAPTPEVSRDKSDRLVSALVDSTDEKPRRRKHDRDAPWFLSGSTDHASIGSSAPLLPAATEADIAEEHVPSAGSLLHRAFHGPDRDCDLARAKDADRESAAVDSDSEVADVGDLATRRAKQNESEGYDIELPFPPFESAQHVAVS